MSQRDIDPLTCPACGARLLHFGLPGKVWCPNGDYHSGRNLLRPPTIGDVLRIQFRRPIWRFAAIVSIVALIMALAIWTGIDPR